MNKLSHRYSGYHSTFSTENVADLFFILFEYLCVRLIHMLETWFDSDEKPHLKVNEMLSFSIVCHKPDSSIVSVYRRVSDVRFTRLSQSLVDTSVQNLTYETEFPKSRGFLDIWWIGLLKNRVSRTASKSHTPHENDLRYTNPWTSSHMFSGRGRSL